MKSSPMKRYHDGTGPKIAHGAHHQPFDSTRYYELEMKFQSLWAIRGLLKNFFRMLRTRASSNGTERAAISWQSGLGQ